MKKSKSSYSYTLRISPFRKKDILKKICFLLRPSYKILLIEIIHFIPERYVLLIMFDILAYRRYIKTMRQLQVLTFFQDELSNTLHRNPPNVLPILKRMKEVSKISPKKYLDPLSIIWIVYGQAFYCDWKYFPLQRKRIKIAVELFSTFNKLKKEDKEARLLENWKRNHKSRLHIRHYISKYLNWIPFISLTMSNKFQDRTNSGKRKSIQTTDTKLHM